MSCKVKENWGQGFSQSAGPVDSVRKRVRMPGARAFSARVHPANVGTGAGVTLGKNKKQIRLAVAQQL